VSPPVHGTPAASPEAKPKKRETVAKRTERKSTGDSQSTRSNAAATPRAASPAPKSPPERDHHRSRSMVGFQEVKKNVGFRNACAIVVYGSVFYFDFNDPVRCL
jgi:hypothetical protein